ncbi:MAG TPA: radical SAM protein [Thermoanaerobaculia bacterium]|nr:radical SAM protein [Thermoanaerobaculia bacterium]
MISALREVDLNVTDRCNLTCEYCSVLVTPVTDRTPELSLERIERLFEEFDELGVQLVRIVGGEPFVRKDIGPILRSAGHRRFRTSVLTNGTALRREHVDLIGSLPSAPSIAFSLDGVTAERHARSRGCPSAFDRTVRMADYCTVRGVEHAMMTVVTAEAVGHLRALVEFAAQHGMQRIRFILLGFTGKAVRSPRAFPTYRAWSEAIVALTRFLRDHGDLPRTSVLFPHEDPVPLELYQPLEQAGLLEELWGVWGIPWRLHGGPLGAGRSWCLAGKHNLTILPNGDAFGCDLMRNIPELKAGNILDCTVREVFEGSAVLDRLRNAPLVHGCASFEDGSQTFSCGQCRAGTHALRASSAPSDGRLHRAEAAR